MCMCVYILSVSSNTKCLIFLVRLSLCHDGPFKFFRYLSFYFIGIHRLKQSMPKRKAGKMAKAYDPIAPVAEEISEEAALLCFDEFQVLVHNGSCRFSTNNILYNYSIAILQGYVASLIDFLY